MISTIREAREIGQFPRVNKSDEHWYSKYFVRYFSIYISYAFFKLGISANFVTILMGVAGLAGSLCIVFSNLWLTLAGAFLWQLWFVLDCVDGEVARLNNKLSQVGVFYDKLTHIIVNSTFVLAMGLHVYFAEPSNIAIIFAITVYSAWHWRREIAHMPLKAVSDADQVKEEVLVREKRKLSLLFFVKPAILFFFSSAIGPIFFIPATIIMSYWFGFVLVKWVLYVYTILLLAYVGIVILRYVNIIKKNEKN